MSSDYEEIRKQVEEDNRRRADRAAIQMLVTCIIVAAVIFLGLGILIGFSIR